MLSLVLLILLGGVLSPLLLVFMVRRRVPHPVLEEHREVAGFIYSVVGVVYAVVLAFSVVIAWEGYRNAENILDQEAQALADLLRSAAVFPEPLRTEMPKALYNYAQKVVREEWPAMRKNSNSSAAQVELDQIWRQISDFNPQNQKESAWLDQALSLLIELSDNRRARLLEARRRLPAIVWCGLVGGAALTIGFSYFFGVKNLKSHLGMTGILTTMVSLNLFIVAALQSPFSGDLQLDPAPFEKVMRTIEIGKALSSVE